MTLTPLISDLNGSGRALTYTIRTCTDFGIDLGATPSCDSRPDLVVVANNQPLTGLTAPTYTGTSPHLDHRSNQHSGFLRHECK